MIQWGTTMDEKTYEFALEIVQCCPRSITNIIGRHTKTLSESLCRQSRQTKDALDTGRCSVVKVLSTFDEGGGGEILSAAAPLRMRFWWPASVIPRATRSLRCSLAA